MDHRLVFLHILAVLTTAIFRANQDPDPGAVYRGASEEMWQR